jgi:long-chain acyl-CoA synthetase
MDFTIADGQLTAKMSVKRHVVAQQYMREINELFPNLPNGFLRT